MAFTPATATGRYTVDGQPATGSVELRLTQPLSQPGETLMPYSVLESLDGAGAFSAPVVATDDPETQPVGGTWTVVERIGGQPVRSYRITVPHLAPLVDLGVTAPALTRPEYGYVLTSALGAPGGVAVLGPDGKVPAQAIPEGVGGIGAAGQPRFSGAGPPGTIIGAAPGDVYLDADNGDLYLLY